MSKRPKYSSKFQDCWSKTHPFLAKDPKDPTNAYCSWCKCTFNVGYGGKNDVTRHMKSVKHKAVEKAINTSSKLDQHFSSGTEEINQVSKAEGLFTAFLANHNLSFNSADHFTKLVPKMFPDSKIAGKFSCSRTKASAIVKEVLGPNEDRDITKLLREKKFALMVDETTDRNTDKQLAILVRVVDGTSIKTKFLDMPICNLSTANDLFQAIDRCFKSRDIPWCNVFAFNSDNCSVMKGQRNGLIAKLQKENPDIVDVGCVCHLANLAVGAALKVLPLNIDELLSDIYNHFKTSTKRMEELKEFQEFVGIEAEKILKHCPTRWLSLRRCIVRLISQYSALKSYFSSHPDAEKPRSKVSIIHSTLQDPTTMAWLRFLEFTLDPFYRFNAKFQSEDVLIVNLHSSMERLIRHVMAMYLPTQPLREQLVSVDLDDQLSDLEINLGTEARAILTAMEEDVASEDITKFYWCVREFYQAAVRKMLKIFPLASEALKMAPAAVPQERGKFTAEDIRKLALSFTFSSDIADKSVHDWVDYQLDEVPDQDPVSFWVDKKTVETYPALAVVMQTLLCLPHSNASCERVFSMLKKIATDQRSLLKSETINCLLRFKINQHGCCVDVEFENALLKELRLAATNYNSRFGSSADNAGPSTSGTSASDPVLID